jgi:cofilin
MSLGEAGSSCRLVSVMNIGVSVNDNCNPAFEAVRQKKGRFATFIIQDAKEIVVNGAGDRDATMEDFFKALSSVPAAYGVFDHEWKTEDGCQKSKLVFVSFVPDTLKPQVKMVYAGAKTGLMQTFKLNQDVHIADVAQLTPEKIQSHCK